MAQGPELSKIQQRVDAVGVRFSELAEDGRRRSERLARLLDDVDSGVARGRQEIDRLTQALAKANEENAQLHDLLQTVLTMAEQVEGPAETMGLDELEARVDRLAAQVTPMNGFADAAEADDDPDKLDDEDRRWEPHPQAGAANTDRKPLELTQMVANDEEFQNFGSRTGHFIGAEFGPVQDIFRRVSMITGKLRET